jgi:SAM-dependent methyltransferase
VPTSLDAAVQVVPARDRAPAVCRSCGAPLERVFVDLGMSPPCEDFLTADRLHEPETFYPLDVRICDACLLVQLPPYVAADEIFTEYAYFSSYSDSWVEHARRYVGMAIERFELGADSFVVEIASNDGYLLQHARGRVGRVLGVDPARNIAAVAIERGIPTITDFFSEALARRMVVEHGPADLLIANNVFAHVPDLRDFTRGLATLLAPRGVLTIEVAHLLRLIEGNQFDTIYHEHFMYYTLLSAEDVLARAGLRVFDVEELDTHGGSLRLFIVHDDDPRPPGDRVAALRDRERGAGYGSAAGYGGFRDRVEAVKRDLLEFLIDARRAGASVVGYGAPGKATTLLNHCGIRTDLIDYLVDRNPYKHGRFTPGTHIPIHPPERLDQTRPDYILVMPWNLRDEIVRQLAPAREGWGARLVVAIPRLEVVGS